MRYLEVGNVVLTRHGEMVVIDEIHTVCSTRTCTGLAYECHVYGDVGEIRTLRSGLRYVARDQLEYADKLGDPANPITPDDEEGETGSEPEGF